MLTGSLLARASDFNALVLEQIRAMPDGGGYATTREAHAALNSSVQLGAGSVSIQPAKACPSYCSGATYLVFLQTLHAAEKKGLMPPLGSVWAALAPKSSPDGVGIWGRWNANGPGASRLFHELALGRNFTSYAEARPGDFMKIFWTDAVGKNERGHLVVQQQAAWLRREERAKSEDRSRHFLPARGALEYSQPRFDSQEGRVFGELADA